MQRQAYRKKFNSHLFRIRRYLLLRTNNSQIMSQQPSAARETKCLRCFQQSSDCQKNKTCTFHAFVGKKPDDRQYFIQRNNELSSKSNFSFRCCKKQCKGLFDFPLSQTNGCQSVENHLLPSSTSPLPSPIIFMQSSEESNNSNSQSVESANIPLLSPTNSDNTQQPQPDVNIAMTPDLSDLIDNINIGTDEKENDEKGG